MIDWPADFGNRFLVTVDVEEEFDWSGPFSATARGMSAIAAMPAMHRRLVSAGVAPVYLADHPAATDPASVAVLRHCLDDAGTAIGAQLHPWVNPPQVGPVDSLASFAGNLPPALEGAKIDSLVTAINDSFGRAPLIYRAGRYGLGPATMALLAARGFRIDSSMRARHDYRRQGGADFDRVGNRAFRLGEGIVEVPLSTVHTGALRRAGPRLHRLAGLVPRGRGALARSRLLSRVPLTPEGVPATEAIAAIAAARADGERLLTLSFHSPSLVPGHTPYVRTAADRAAFDRWWDVVLAGLSREGYAPVTLDAVIAASERACQPPVPSASPAPPR